MKRKDYFLTFMIINCFLLLPSVYAEPVLINGLEISDRYQVQGRNVPDVGGNAFIIHEQFDNNCGPTSVEMVLHYYAKFKTLAHIWATGGIHHVVW
ncbi:hypothetical protein JT359_10860 [Candidatus Poribacteria bacterium]|nr:hypothetical protein [Candidatus Poribacteria bacterium]